MPADEGSWVGRKMWIHLLTLRKKRIYSDTGTFDQFQQLTKLLTMRSKKFVNKRAKLGDAQSEYMKRLRRQAAACPSYCVNSIALERYGVYSLCHTSQCLSPADFAMF